MEAMSSNAFKSVIEIDVLGTFNTIKATTPHLLRSSTPRIIFVSVTFHYTGVTLQAHVAAAKSAVDSLMASVALEYGPRGFTSNSIAPGGIADTEGLARLGSSADGEKENYEKQIPSGRMGTVKDIADATVFLFSEAGSYVNGQALAVDGAAWRRQGGIALGTDTSMQYPEYLLSGKVSEHLKDGRKEKPKL